MTAIPADEPLAANDPNPADEAALAAVLEMARDAQVFDRLAWMARLSRELSAGPAAAGHGVVRSDSRRPRDGRQGRRAATPGSTLPSSHSRNAPPAVET